VSDDEAKTKLAELRKRIQSGEDFAGLARTYSEDPGSAKQGGDLGWVDANSNLDPTFFNVVQNTAVGEVSEPFKTSFGWHIVQVEARRSEDQTEENQRQAARRMIQSSKSLEEMQTWLNQLRDESHIDIRDKTLQDKEDE
jgi:peptidyl-prolyl cis-trans isomerase SurA